MAVTPSQVLAAVESALLGPAPPTPAQRLELLHALRAALPSFQSLLSYPAPNASDRAQVQLKEVRLPDSGPISLDDQDVQLALKLSDDLNLNEVDCVRLLVSANQVWGLFGREPLEILRLAAGLWYTERRDILTSLYTLLRASVLDPGLEADIRAEIGKYLENLFKSGLRQRFISLIKELNREEPSGLGGPQAECYLLDSKGALVERRAVVSRERLSLGHCLVLSVLVVRMSSKDIKDVLSLLKECAVDVHGATGLLKLQIVYSLLFALLIAFTSDALSSASDNSSALSQDLSFKREFHELVMASSNDPNIEGFVDAVRLSWFVYIALTQDEKSVRDTISGASTSDQKNVYTCLEHISSNNVFEFLLDKVLRTTAYQNDDEDIIYMYNAYMHKLMMCFLSHPLAKEKVKELKEKAMNALSPYRTGGLDSMDDTDVNLNGISGPKSQPFISLLEFVSEIYRKEPEIISGSEELWTFIYFAGEDHSNFHTLVAFLRMLSSLASSEEGASMVFELLQGKAFRSIGWSTLFDCLSIYEQKFKQSLQGSGAVLPEIQEGDARALVAYLDVLQKVVENGNAVERKKWFPDIEPLFKLLSYENVPPYLKGALRNAIASFIQVSPILKDTIWSYLEQYDLPVVVGPPLSSGQQISAQVYDMRFELNEVEARLERYPSTISFLNLLNALIAEERDTSDRGRRFVGIFRFVYDHVFGPFPQRAYADSCEKWQLVVACLKHFKLILTMYDVGEEDVDSIAVQPQPPMIANSALEVQLPTLELIKDFMSGKAVFHNIMGIVLPSVNALISDRTDQTYGVLLEKAVQLSLEILVLIFAKDLMLSEFLRPLYQPLDVILSQDPHQIVVLLEYVRYNFLPEIQLCSIKIMSILSSRMVGLVQLLLKSNAANCLIEDYAACLEQRLEELQFVENTRDDAGVLILQLLIDNISRPAPNVSHLLLKFHMDSPVERTVLQPKYHYSCLKVALDILEKLSKPEINALVHEFSFQLLYELCLDPLTCGPTVDLLSSRKYQFFSMHLDTVGVAPLPKRNHNQSLRISSLHQRSWLLKLLALELHIGDTNELSHREACTGILAKLFAHDARESIWDPNLTDSFLPTTEQTSTESVNKSKVHELLEVVQFRSPDTNMKYTQFVPNLKYDMQVEEILANPATSDKGGLYFYSERGDRLIDLPALRDKLWQRCSLLSPQPIDQNNESLLVDLRESIQQILRWGWRYNKNLEEQAAQLHMLTGWSQIVEVAVSRRMSFLQNRSKILFEVLDATLSASASPDCSLKMAIMLTQVALTCVAKLRDERFLCPGGVNSDNVTCLDIILVKQLPNGACHSVLFKLIMAFLRHESSETLRRRQYALLLSYFQYCHSVLHPEVPVSILHYLLREDQVGEEELDLQKVDKEQAELAQANFSLLKREARAILDVVVKDAIQGSEAGKAMSFYVLDAFISIDQDRFFLSQLQSRGILRLCLGNISNFFYQDIKHSLEAVQRLYTRESEMALLLRISHHYGKSGAQVLFSMGVLEHLTSCKVSGLHVKGSFRGADMVKVGRNYAIDIDKQRLIIPPILRLVSSLTCLVDTSDFLEVRSKIVREIVDFVRGQQALIDQILREEVFEGDELAMEQINLVVAILSKVWPYDENDECGLIQGLFRLMCTIFPCDIEVCSNGGSNENQKHPEGALFQLCFSLCSYLYFLVTKKNFRLRVSDGPVDSQALVRHPQPTLMFLAILLSSATKALERAAEEKLILLNKIQDINELSRQEVDEIINLYMRQNCILPSDNIRKRRYIAMIEMCEAAGNKDGLISMLLKLAEHILNIILIHFQDSSTIPIDKVVAESSMKFDFEEHVSFFCEKLLPSLERLELLNEDKVGYGLKVFRRLVSSLKEMAIQKLSP